MKLGALIVAILPVAACAPVPYGGEGQTRSGEPIAAEARLGMNGWNEVILTSAAGWSCSGIYRPADSPNSTTRRFPLTCSNGARGNAVMSVNQIAGRATVVFSLTNGESGRVAFGHVG